VLKLSAPACGSGAGWPAQGDTLKLPIKIVLLHADGKFRRPYAVIPWVLPSRFVTEG